MSGRLKGYLIGALAAASYGTNPLFALPLYADGMNPVSVLLFRYLIAIPLTFAMIMSSRGNMRLESPKLLIPLIILGLCMGGSSLTLFLSYTYMPAGIASTILFIYPIAVVMIMGLLYHEKVKIATLFCIVVAMVGIFLLYYDGEGTTLHPIGTILIIVSALTYAIYLVGLNRTKLGQLDPLVTTFYVVIVSVVMFFCFLRFGRDITLPQHWYSWFNILALAILPTVVSFFATAYAVQHIGSTPTAVLGALEPATAVTIGILVFNETITLRIAIGLMMVIGSVTVLILRK